MHPENQHAMQLCLSANTQPMMPVCSPVMSVSVQALSRGHIARSTQSWLMGVAVSGGSRARAKPFRKSVHMCSGGREIMKEIKQDDMLKISEEEGGSSKRALGKRKRQAGQYRGLNTEPC